jgi:hypothetical protein
MFDDARAVAAPPSQPPPMAEPLSWSTPVAYEPDLPDRLTLAHRELTVTLELLAEAAGLSVAAAVAEAARSFVQQMHALHRLEARRLYPIIARRKDLDADGMTSFTRTRLEIAGMGRRVLRVLESALEPGSEGALGAADVRFAMVLLQRYVQDKEARLFPLYRAAATS